MIFLSGGGAFKAPLMVGLMRKVQETQFYIFLVILNLNASHKSFHYTTSIDHFSCLQNAAVCKIEILLGFPLQMIFLNPINEGSRMTRYC